MHNLATLIIFGIFSILLPGLFLASFTTGELSKECEALQKTQSEPEKKILYSQAMHCAGYISGFRHGIEAINDWPASLDGNKQTSIFFCIPKEVRTGQLIKVFLKYTNNNPEILHYPAAAVLILSFHSSFPCITHK